MSPVVLWLGTSDPDTWAIKRGHQVRGSGSGRCTRTINYEARCVELKRARLNDELRKDLLVTDETWWQRDDEVDLNWKAANIE